MTRISRSCRFVALLIGAPLALATPALASGPLFEAPFYSYETAAKSLDTFGGKPLEAFADFNLDGNIDVAVVNPDNRLNSTYGTVSIFLGRGDGTFLPRVDVAAGNGANTIAVGKMNRDAWPDLVVGGGFDVAVLIGNGLGGFSGANYQAGLFVQTVAVEDLNGDGNTDIVAGDNGRSWAAVMLGNGAGNYVSSTVPSHGAFMLLIDDLDADGKKDVLVASGLDYGFLRGHGDGTFDPETYIQDGWPFALAIADVNGDGLKDIVAADIGSSLDVKLATAPGVFGPAVEYPIDQQANSVAVGDWNDDGKLDIAAASEYSNKVWTMDGDGAGGFAAPASHVLAMGPIWAGSADLNGDGRSDLVVRSYPFDAISVAPAGPAGIPAVTREFATGSHPRAIAVADLDGDGRADAAVANAAANTISVLLASGGGDLSPGTDHATGARPNSVAVSDLNGDARPDLVVANAGANSVSVLLGTGGGAFGPKSDYGTAAVPQSVAIGDFNGDGHPDLAVACRGEYLASVLLGNGAGTFGARTDFATGSPTSAIATGDVNGDSNLDLVVASDTTSAVKLLLGTGTGSFGPRKLYSVIRPGSLVVTDLNGDGLDDVVASTVGSNTISVLMGLASGTFTPRKDFVTGPQPAQVVVADIDGDGYPDLVTANNTYTASVLLGNGSGSFPTHTEYGVGRDSVTVGAGDVNGDGNPDLVLASSRSNLVSVLLSTRGPTLDVAPGTMAHGGALDAPHPNPFRSSVTFELNLPVQTRVRLEVADVQGRRVRLIRDGVLSPGRQTQSWDGTRLDGTGAPAGLYFVRLTGPGIDVTRKAFLVR